MVHVLYEVEGWEGASVDGGVLDSVPGETDIVYLDHNPDFPYLVVASHPDPAYWVDGVSGGAIVTVRQAPTVGWSSGALA